MHIHTSDQPHYDLGFGGYTCNGGVHMAGLYETDKERQEIIMGFLHQGDLDGDLQFFAPESYTAQEFFQDYSERYPEQAGHTKDSNRFAVQSCEELYYPDGTFSPWAMDDGLNEFYINSQRQGLKKVRATADMVWAKKAIPGVEHLMAYEARLNYFIPGKPWISICLYSVKEFSGDVIMNVLRTHPYTLSGGVITENPYYQDPTSWLEKNAPQYLPN